MRPSAHSLPALTLCAVALLVATSAATSPPATADTLEATRSQRLIETRHRVDVEVRDGLAYYTVRRTFHNYGKVAEEGKLEIALPHGAVATGLRIKGKGRWFEGELMHATRAEELYQELTGLGPSEPKDPALLYWKWTDELALRVFPIFPGTSNTIEYSLTAPTTYEGGFYYATYGRKGEDAQNLATPIVHVKGGRYIEIDGERSKRVASLKGAEAHPLLQSLGWGEEQRAMVRPLVVRGESNWSSATLKVRIKHTWRGDIALAIVDPSGELHSVRTENLGDDENDLSESFAVPYKGDPNGTWHLLVADHHPLDGGMLLEWTLEQASGAGRKFRDAKPRSIPQPTDSRASEATIGIQTGSARESTLRLGRVALVDDKQFTRLEIDVAKKLSELPRPLSVSFVLDASHTMETSGIDAQLQLIEAYLAHVPWAEFSLVAYGRYAEELTGGFVKAKNFASIRDGLRKQGKLAPRNGSFLGRGIAKTVPALATQKGSRAMVLLTDDRLRPNWETQAALAELAGLPNDVVVHVAEVSAEGELSVTRDDDHRLFPLAKARGGVAVVARGIAESKPVELAPEALYLVRPTRIDHIAIEGFSDNDEDVFSGDDNGALYEGRGRRWMSMVYEAPRKASLKGQLWSRPISLEARADDEPFNKATAGFVFSLDHYDALTDSEQFVVASYGNVVSPVTSFLAIEPGVRPSTIGLQLSGQIGHGSGSGSGSMGSSAYGPGIQWPVIKRRIQRLCRKHGAVRVSVKLSLQSHEIADIALGSKSSNAALEQCIVEALWDTPLGARSSLSRSWSKELVFDMALERP